MCMIFHTMHIKSEKICKTKGASRLEQLGALKGFQTAIHLRCCIGGIHSAGGIHVFHLMVTVWYG
jgi:hypothetical protein